MSDEKPMGQVIQIDEARIRDHLGEMVRGTVEETLNAGLGAQLSCTVVSTMTRAKSFGFIASVPVATDKLSWNPLWPISGLSASS
jgi:hypothetical protein